MTRVALSLVAVAATALAQSTVWSGDVHLSHDVEIGRDEHLEIRPGTRIWVGADTKRSGWNKDLVEIRVRGQVTANGTLDRPIVFDGFHDWMGIALLPLRRRDSVLTACTFVGARAGVQVGGRGVRLVDCLFVRCDTGVGTGALWADRGVAGPEVEVSTPTLLRCRFWRCRVGVSVEGNGRPEILRSLFLQCDRGIGNRRPGTTLSANGLGALVDRCEFHVCLVALTGSCGVTNSLFVHNVAVYASSAFHAPHASDIDRFSRSHCLYWRNGRIADRDISPGRGSVFADPRHVAPPSTGTLGDRLDVALRLGPGSPALGAAADGGDCGAAGRTGDGGRALVRVRPAPVVIDRWLTLGPRPRLSKASVRQIGRRYSRKLPSVGSSKAGATWSFVTSSEWLALPGTYRAGVAELVATRGALATLEIGIEGSRSVWWNGGELPGDHESHPVELRPGTNVLFVGLEGEGHAWVGATRLKFPSDGPIVEIRPVEPEPRAETIEIEDVIVEKRRRDEGAFDVGVRLSHDVHWIDAEDAARHRIGSRTAERAIYDRKRRTLWLRGLAIQPAVWRVELGRLRDPAGRLFAPPLVTRRVVLE